MKIRKRLSGRTLKSSKVSEGLAAQNASEALSRQVVAALTEGKDIHAIAANLKTDIDVISRMVRNVVGERQKFIDDIPYQRKVQMTKAQLLESSRFEQALNGDNNAAKLCMDLWNYQDGLTGLSDKKSVQEIMLSGRIEHSGTVTNIQELGERATAVLSKYAEDSGFKELPANTHAAKRDMNALYVRTSKMTDPDIVDAELVDEE